MIFSAGIQSCISCLVRLGLLSGWDPKELKSLHLSYEKHVLGVQVQLQDGVHSKGFCCAQGCDGDIARVSFRDS